MKKIILITLILSLASLYACQSEPAVILENNHEAVDLGLPSGTLWATCNVGASTPEEEGTPFAYGETQKKTVFDWNNYQLVEIGGDNGRDMYKKYNIRKSAGVTDNLLVLQPEDDVASVEWGGSWRMPTKEDAEELIEKCHFVYDMHDDVEGFVVTGPNGNSIYMAFNQTHGSDTTWTHYEGAFFRTSSVMRDDGGYCNHAWLLAVSRRAGTVHSYRYVGLPVRPVCKRKDKQ